MILRKEIKMVNPSKVTAFLNQHPHLFSVLNDIIAKIPEDFLRSSRVEHYKDIEEHWEKLFLLIETGVEDFYQFEKLEEELYSTIMEPLDNSISEIILSVK